MRFFLALVLTAGLLAGCASPGIDWAARLGNYTFDQAVLELGPPDKSARLTDGTVVAEWLTRRAQVIMQPNAPFMTPGYTYAPFPPSYNQTYIPGTYVRLTFGPNGKLAAQKYISK